MKDGGNEKDPATMTYDVSWEDAQGQVHHLSLVRNLTVTDLPSNSPRCNKSSTAASVSTPH